MIKIFTTILMLVFVNSLAYAGSFSEIFGSEGARGVTNSKTRSLSYSLQYLAFTGVSGFLIKNLHDSGFFEPLGLTPESYKKMSPLAYDNPNYSDKINDILQKNTKSINELNNFFDNQKVMYKRSPSIKNMARNRNDSFTNFIYNQDKREMLIDKYYGKD